jgi:hypothetical protein
MNAFAMYSAQEALFLAHERTQELIDQADAHRTAIRAPKGRSTRVGAVIASITGLFRAPEPSSESTVVPRLSDYPYRG